MHVVGHYLRFLLAAEVSAVDARSPFLATCTAATFALSPPLAVFFLVVLVATSSS